MELEQPHKSDGVQSSKTCERQQAELKYISSKSQAKENVCLVLKGADYTVMKNTED